MGRVLFHIDLNAFYANAEILKNSSYENQPLVVSGLSRRGVVCTASYAARELGIHSAMPIKMALQLCPHLIVVPVDFEWYEKLSKQFFDYIRTFSPYVEPMSIDECFVDVTKTIKQYKRPLDLAWQIQQGLKDELGLSCSIGVAPNRFLAKMASDMRKPMGITILRKQEISKKLWPLPIEDMWGIGRKTAPVQSLSQSTTMNQDVEDYEEIKNIFRRLATELAIRLNEEKVQGKTISISIRYSDFSTIVRSFTMESFTNQADVLLEHALYLFDKNNLNGQPIRHLGIALGSLTSNKNSIEQISFFETKAITKQDVLDELNRHLCEPKLMFASDLIHKKSE